jgi:hypothetical protein
MLSNLILKDGIVEKILIKNLQKKKKTAKRLKHIGGEIKKTLIL